MKRIVEIITRSENETRKLGALFAKTIVSGASSTARVISLDGNLGAGKTTFVKGFCRALGINEIIQSPTFVILKIYHGKEKKNRFNIIHIDAYRILPKDLKILEWRRFYKNPENIIIIEWGGRIKKILPKESYKVRFLYWKKSTERIISFS